MKKKFAQKFFCFMSLTTIITCSASAQNLIGTWKWRDEKGVTIYSDSPPPASISQSQIVAPKIDNSTPLKNVEKNNLDQQEFAEGVKDKDNKPNLSEGAPNVAEKPSDFEHKAAQQQNKTQAEQNTDRTY